MNDVAKLQAALQLMAEQRNQALNAFITLQVEFKAIQEEVKALKAAQGVANGPSD